MKNQISGAGCQVSGVAVQAFELRAAAVIVFLMLAFCFSAGAQERTVAPATQAEVDAGTIHNKFVAPDTLAHWSGGGGGGGPTNGITQAQYQQAIQSGTNIFKGSNVSVLQTFTSSLVVTNGQTNLSLTALTDLEADANKKIVSLANAAGVKTNDGAGHVGYTLVLPAGIDASLVTNLLNLAKFTGGANITATPSRDPVTGATNWTFAVSDPASFNQVNSVGVTTTNFYTRTNDMTGVTVVDFSTGSMATYDGLASGLTITGFQGAVAGVYNQKIIAVRASGNQTVGFPPSWRLAPSVTGTATNGDWTYYWVDMQPSHYTNVLEVYVH